MFEECKKQRKLNENINSNEVLVKEAGDDVTFYLPCYLRFKVKNVTDIKVSQLHGSLNGIIVFSLYYGNLKNFFAETPQVFNKLKTSVSLQLNHQDAIILTEDTKGVVLKDEKDKFMLTFFVRKIFNFAIQSDVFWSPFQLISFIDMITVQEFFINKDDPKFTNQKRADSSAKGGQQLQPKKLQKNLMFRFNLMKPNKGELTYLNNIDYGNYDLAELKLKADYSNIKVPSFKPKNPDEDRELTKPSKSFQYAHLQIPFYKYPSSALATIFIPMLLLTLVNLAIFFQAPNLGERIGSISTLVLAFIALIPTIHQQIPPTSSIIFVEIMVFLQAFTCLLCLFQSFVLSGISKRKNYKFKWNKDPFFILASLITILSFGFIIGLFIYHKWVWQPSYNSTMQKDPRFNEKSESKQKKSESKQKKSESKQKKSESKQKNDQGDKKEEKGPDINLKRQLSRNKGCDEYFSKVNGIVELLPPKPYIKQSRQRRDSFCV